MPEISKLTVEATELRKEVARLRLAVQQLGPRVERAERVSIRAALASTVVVFLVLATALVAWRQYETDRRIDGLCPILALVVGGANPETRPPGPAREEYVANVQVMRQAYYDLGCTTPFVAPRVEPTP